MPQVFDDSVTSNLASPSQNGFDHGLAASRGLGIHKKNN